MKAGPTIELAAKYQVGVFLSALLLFSQGQVATAHNKVVVVPLAGDDAVSHPAATTITNSIGMQFNELPKGIFTMGSPRFGTPEPGRDDDELPHRVTLSKAFKMQTTEVTNAQWNHVIVDAALGINPSPSNQGDNDYPVYRATWYDAVFFANRLSINEGKSECYSFTGVSGAAGSSLLIATVTRNVNCAGYQLPTEAQWEYAARAGTTKAYANPLGFDSSDTETGGDFNGNLHAMGWYFYNETGMGYASGNKPVAKKQANSWGLYDMHGNVWEWVWDWYGPYSGAETDPIGPADGLGRAVRSGNFGGLAKGARSADRGGSEPANKFFNSGFRLVLPAS